MNDSPPRNDHNGLAAGSDVGRTSSSGDGSDRRFDAVLFDFGGVFTESPFEHISNSAKAMGIEVGTLTDVIFGPYGDDTDHPWHRLERGDVTIEDATTEINALARASGIGVDPWQILMGMASSGTREYMVETVEIVRSRGLAVAIVTNNLKEFAEHWKKMIPMELIDHVSDSSAMGVRKPNPVIYTATLEALGVSAERSIFVDDAPGNVAAAAALGITSILVPHDDAGARSVSDQIRQLTA